MSSQNSQIGSSEDYLQPEDILAGLGFADKKLLATLIALFEDSTLSKRIQEKTGNSLKKIGEVLNKVSQGRISDKKINDIGDLYFKPESIESRIDYLTEEGRFSDSNLRLILWMYIRNSLGLDPSLPVSTRSLRHCASEMTAAVIHIADPPSWLGNIDRKLSGEDRSKNTLHEIAEPVINELMESIVQQLEELDDERRNQVYETIRSEFQDLDNDQRDKLLRAVGADEFNDAAIRNILITGSGLATIGSSVSIAGFSAYILAAKASAFIPLVSGPGLVSFLAVIANPVTLVAGTVATAMWARNKANKNIQASLAITITSLLAFIGMSNREKNRFCQRRVLKSFSSIDNLHEFGELPSQIIEQYRERWLLYDHKLKSIRHSDIPDRLAWMDYSAEALLNEVEKNRIKDHSELKKTAWVSGLTVGDVIHSLYAINPEVVLAADFSRIDDLGDKISFSEFAQDIMSLESSAFTGSISNLKGYVAEQVVAMQLTLQGHDVQFPGTSNEKGWDLLVDGEKFQVKSLDDVNGVQAHFGNYDYPVIANSELSEILPEELADRVYFVEGFSDSTVTGITEESLQYGSDAMEPDVPLFAIGVSSAFALRDYSDGRIRGDQAIEQIILDGGARAGLATIGGFIGSGVGLLFYGPAGALIWGALTPVLAQSQASKVSNALRSRLKTIESKEWEERVSNLRDRLIAILKEVLNQKIIALRNRYKSLDDGILSDMLKHKMSDEGIYLREVLYELSKIESSIDTQAIDQVSDLLQLLPRSTVHPVKFQKELIELEGVISKKPSLL